MICPIAVRGDVPPAGTGPSRSRGGDEIAKHEKPHRSLAYLPQRRRRGDQGTRGHGYPYLLSSGVTNA